MFYVCSDFLCVARRKWEPWLRKGLKFSFSLDPLVLWVVIKNAKHVKRRRLRKK